MTELQKDESTVRIHPRVSRKPCRSARPPQMRFPCTGRDSIDDLEITQQGDDVLIDYGKGEILLENTELADVLGADIFVS